MNASNNPLSLSNSPKKPIFLLSQFLEPHLIRVKLVLWLWLHQHRHTLTVQPLEVQAQEAHQLLLSHKPSNKLHPPLQLQVPVQEQVTAKQTADGHSHGAKTASGAKSSLSHAAFPQWSKSSSCPLPKDHRRSSFLTLHRTRQLETSRLVK